MQKDAPAQACPIILKSDSPVLLTVRVEVMRLVWDKPVIVFYRERVDEPEREAFLVVKARKLMVLTDRQPESISGSIKDFFPLMGDIDYFSSEKGISDQYVLCWFDDKEEDFSKAWRRLTGVTFPNGTSFVVDMMKKKTYNADFKAKEGKLE